MIEFAWFLFVLGAGIGFSVSRTLPMRIRWGVVIGLLMLGGGFYVWHHHVSRVILNALLFFDRHTILLAALLALSLFGFVLAWYGQWTRRGLMAGLVVGITVTVLLAVEWYCALVVLLALALVALLYASRQELGLLGWICALLLVFLIVGLFVTRISYGQTRADYIEAGVVVGFSALGLLWGWRKRLWLVAALSGFIMGVTALGVLLIQLGTNVSHIVDTMGDYVVIGLIVAFIGALIRWVGRARFQPLGWASAVMIVFLAGGLSLATMLYGTPEDFADIEDQFKYGSIGSDHFLARGIPYFIWEALPRRFAPEDILMGPLLPTAGIDKEDYRPRYGTEETDKEENDQPKEPKQDYPKGRTYEAFGLLKENNKTARLLVGHKDVDTIVDRPIGFSKRQVFGLDFVGINCAFCHASTIRKDAGSKREVVLGMPANTVDIELFFLFLFAAAGHPEFTSHTIMAQILTDHPDMRLGRQVLALGAKGICREIQNGFHRLTYRLVLIPLTRKYTQWLKADFSFIDPKHPDHLPRFGPGRVDAWNPGKKTLIKPPLPVEYPGGLIDDSAIWNQKARSGMRFHWDGNINNIDERNIIAGLVVTGPQIECLDTKRIGRITDWILERPAPRFDDFEPLPKLPYDLMEKRSKGKELFGQWCASCHAPDGERIGRVEPLQARELGTDPFRMKTFTAELQNDLNKIERPATNDAEAWRLRSFRVQDGYVNMLLDGVWLRAPYLHNGSVPTLRDLLDRPCDGPEEQHCRPQTFVRGNDIYDMKAGGFRFTLKSEPGDTLDVHIRGQQPITGIRIGPDGTVHDSRVHGLDGKVAGFTTDELASKVAEATRAVLSSNLRRGPEKDERKDLKAKEPQPSRLVIVQIRRRGLFIFDTRLPGNSNQGHLYGTDLFDDDKDAIVEYLKTL